MRSRKIRFLAQSLGNGAILDTFKRKEKKKRRKMVGGGKEGKGVPIDFPFPSSVCILVY